MLKAILFDRDGTLLESTEANKYFCWDVLGLAGYKNIPEEKIAQSNHLAFWDRIKFLTKETDEEKVRQIWNLKEKVRYRRELLGLAKDEVKILKQLSKKYLLSVVTNATRSGIQGFYEVSGLENNFTEGVSADDVTNPKPDPEPLLIALQKLNLEPKEAIYVGDSSVDLEASKAAGMKFINLNVFNKEKVEGADFYAGTFRELEEIIITITTKFS